MNMAKMKGTSRVVWMSDEDVKTLQAISDMVDLPQTQVISRIVAAGLKSIAANGNRFEVPLRFQTLTHQDVTRWQETEPLAHKRK